MSHYFIGIDVSTTASKAIAVDAQGKVVASQGYPHEHSTPRPLWSEQDPDNWWEASCKALRDVLQQVPADEIGAVGLTGQMHGLVSLDENGKSLRPAILWNDGRSGAQCGWMIETVGAHKLHTIMGSGMQAGLTAPKIMWVRDHEPEIYAQIKHVLLPKDYVRFKLSGAYVTDVTEASGVGAVDVARRVWSDELLEAFGIPKAWLPELCESPDICAYVDEAGAAATGLKIGTPIVGGAGDQPATSIGMGIISNGHAGISVGTSGVAFAFNERYMPEPDGRLHTFCGPAPKTWLHLGVMLSAAGSLRWFQENVAPATTYDELNRIADSVPRGSLGLLFAPYLTGERNPHPDPLARAAFVGLTLRHGLAQMARAVMEGVAFGMRDQLELLRVAGVNPQAGVLSGGMANSPVWRMLMAEILGIPLYTINTTEGAAFGAAILAAVGAGAWPDVQTACANMVRKVEEFTPDTAGMAEYERLYATYRGLYSVLRETNHMLAGFEG
jgi:xylulokinase